MNISKLAPELLKSAVSGLTLDDVDIAVNNGYILVEPVSDEEYELLISTIEFENDETYEETFRPDEFEIDEGPLPSEKDEFFA